MRSVFWIGVISAGICFSGAANARNGAWYVGGDFGAMIVEDTEFELGGAATPIILDHDYGFDGSASIGYDLGAFRLEAEVGYRRAEIDQLRFGANPFEAAAGSTGIFSLIANGAVDFSVPVLDLGAFAGAGAGFAEIDFNNLHSVAFPNVSFDGSDTAFAWQIFAGLRKQITDRIDVTGQYNFFNAPDVRIPTYLGDDEDTSISTHSIRFGIIYLLQPPPPPPPPA